MAELNPEDYNYFRQSRRRVDDTYKLGLSQNQYQRDMVQGAYGRQQANLATQFAQMRDRIPGGLARRGLLNSGIAQQKWSQFRTNRASGFSDLAAQRDEQLAGLELGANQMEATRASSVFDLQEQEAARRAAVASTLRAAQGLGY